MTIAEQLAREAKELQFRELPPEVVHQVKRSLLDTLGVALCGYPSEPSRIIQSMIKEANEPPESTVYVSGLKTSCQYASLANGAMLRYPDYSDRAFLTKEARVFLGHHSNLIPPILAVGERQRSSGQEIITVIVLAYELCNKIYDAAGGSHRLRERGWTTESMGHACITGLLAARLFGLDEKQMANALAIAGCFSLQPGIMLSPGGARNMRTPFGAYGGILSALLASKGFTGGLEVFEGRQGLAQAVAGGEMDLEKLKQPRKDWTILSTWVKTFACDGDMQGLLEATVTLVKRHDTAPEDVAEVKIKTNSYNYRLADPVKRRHPNNKYTADHSLYYTTAVAVVDRAVGPEQFSEQKLWDPRVRELLDKVVVEPDPSLEEFSSPGIAEITTKKGEKYRCEIHHPKGHPMNPVTDADLEEKFRSMASEFMDENQMSRVIDAIYNLEKLEDISGLIKLLVIPEQTASR